MVDLLKVFYFEVRMCLLAISVQVRSIKQVINDLLKFKLSNLRFSFIALLFSL